MLGKFLEVLVPITCIGCHRSGTGLCTVCAPIVPVPLQQPPLTSLVASGYHDGQLRHAIHHLKFNRRRTMAAALAARLVPLLPPADIVCAIPASGRHLRTRGFNPAEAIARRLPLPYRPLLHRLGSAQQVGRNRQQRAEQAMYAFAPRLPATIAGRRIILVDDVTTTGATMAAAAAQLRQAGAAEVHGVAIAYQPYAG